MKIQLNAHIVADILSHYGVVQGATLMYVRVANDFKVTIST